jgi:hypothetical protein
MILRNWNDSRIFDNVAVSDIGRRSENISAIGVVFGTGITSASFHCLGACMVAQQYQDNFVYILYCKYHYNIAFNLKVYIVFNVKYNLISFHHIK